MPSWIVFFALVFSFCAAITNVYAALSFRHTRLSYALWITAVLAFTYNVSYIWLLTHYDRAADWSQVMRPVGMVSWLIPWTALPLAMLRYVHRRADELDKKVTDAISDFSDGAE